MKKAVKAVFITSLSLFFFSCSSSVLEEREKAKVDVNKLEEKRSLSRPSLKNLLSESCEPKIIDNKLTKSSCDNALICLPLAENSQKGTCELPCGIKKEDRVVKDHSVCPKDYACMMRKNRYLESTSLFCGKKAHEEEQCMAAFDRDACVGNLSCIPSISGLDESGRRIFTRSLCKAECLKDGDCMRTSEQCLKPSYARKEAQPRKNDPGKPEICSLSACQANDASCSCEKERGFSCEALMLGLDFGHCRRELGICGQAIALANPRSFQGRSYVGENCNEISDNRYCESFPHASPKQARPECHRISKTLEGLCVAFCKSPALDLNHDGLISTNERAEMLDCPKDYACSTEVSRAIGMVNYITMGDAYKSCNPELCQDQKPCPLQCGPGDAECVKLVVNGHSEYVCGAPFSSCIAQN
jgi:hypothetical protein